MDAPPRAPPRPRTEKADKTETEPATQDALALLPHADTFPKMKFMFEPQGEPTQNEDTERPEAIDTEHQWDPQSRPAWQLHSERGPNIEAEAKASKPTKLFEELVNPQTPPAGRAYERHWSRGNYNVERFHATWERFRSEHAQCSDEHCQRTLCRSAINCYSFKYSWTT